MLDERDELGDNIVGGALCETLRLLVEGEEAAQI